jgi:hypothetical protein
MAKTAERKHACGGREEYCHAQGSRRKRGERYGSNSSDGRPKGLIARDSSSDSFRRPKGLIASDSVGRHGFVDDRRSLIHLAGYFLTTKLCPLVGKFSRGSSGKKK